MEKEKSKQKIIVFCEEGKTVWKGTTPVMVICYWVI